MVKRFTTGPVTLALCSFCSACGNPSDAELPINVDSIGSVPPEKSHSAAVLDLHADGVEAAMCSLDAHVTLPDQSAGNTLFRGFGPRLQNGENADIQCRVQPSSARPGVFEIDLGIQQQPAFQLQLDGFVTESRDNAVTLSASIAGVGHLVANCAADVRTLVVGAVWIDSMICVEPSLDSKQLTACTIVGAAIFEHCGR
ncbi:MAG TPA: hypothetical protein VFS67_25975 [Polyangiaceae bacterium]|nr:hypothetical protein [Polyangiaceae bacterium]